MTDRAQARRPELEEIFREQVGFVWRALRSFGIPDADVEDVAQEVFVVVHKRLGEWDGDKVREWLYTIAQRVASNHRRKNRTRAVAFDTRERRAEPVEPLEDRETLRRLEAALAELDDDKRTVFVLYEVEQMTMNEIAGTVSVPLKTAYARLYAARTFLANRLGLEEEEP